METVLSQILARESNSHSAMDDVEGTAPLPAPAQTVPVTPVTLQHHPIPMTAQPIPLTAIPSSAPAKKAKNVKKYGSLSLDELRKPLKNVSLTGIERLELLKNMNSFVLAQEGKHRAFDNASCCFYFSTIAPLISCYTQHFASNSENFLQSHQGLKRISKFKCVCPRNAS
jgi:hypothetical protein